MTATAQVLQLPLGIVEGIAQRKIDILVPCAIAIEAVGVDLRARHGQIYSDHIGCPAVAAAIRALQSHVTAGDPVAEAPQSRAQNLRALLEGA